MQDTKLLVSWNDDTIVIAFRGTSSMANALADLQVTSFLPFPMDDHLDLRSSHPRRILYGQMPSMTAATFPAIWSGNHWSLSLSQVLQLTSNALKK